LTPLFPKVGIQIAAWQPMSPEWSLKANLSGEIQTVLSLQLGPIIEERDEADFGHRILNYCFRLVF